MNHIPIAHRLCGGGLFRGIIAKAETGQGSPAQLANLFRVSRSTVQRVLRDQTG